MMERRIPVTLEEVGAAIEYLRAKGEKITMRNVHFITGGYAATVSMLIKQWTELEQDVNARSDINDECLNMILRRRQQGLDQG